MLILLRSFILSNFMWVLLASSVASGFAGGYAVRTWYKASESSELKQEVVKLNNETGKANEAETTVDGLGDGIASDRLFREWSRKGE